MKKLRQNGVRYCLPRVFTMRQGYIASGTYLGKERKLRGKTALVRRGRTGCYLLQFDDTKLRKAYGWHRYRRSEVRLRE